MRLTDLAIRTAKPAERPYRLHDTGGLYVEVAKSGSKLWRFKYRIQGREKRLALGTYPGVGLAEARKRRDAAREQLANNIDPSVHKQEQKLAAQARAAAKLGPIALEWYQLKQADWAKSHADKVYSRLKTHLIPLFGDRPIADITREELVSNLQVIGRTRPETAKRVLEIFRQVIRYKIATGLEIPDPTVGLEKTLPSWKPKHYAAPTDPAVVASLLRGIDSYAGGVVVSAMLRLAPLVFVRPGELRQAEWGEIDMHSAMWIIPAHKMKMRQRHHVPLSTQAVAILSELQPLTGRGRYVFFGGRDLKKPLSNNTMNAALRSMGFDKETITGHGFRAIARTLLDEILRFRTPLIELQLAHSLSNPHGQAYSRGDSLEWRRQMMQAWADYLDVLKAGDPHAIEEATRNIRAIAAGIG